MGQEIAAEIGKRKGDRPNPGTIYPALKELAKRGLIEARPDGRNLVYELTRDGRASLSKSVEYFKRAFGKILQERTKAPTGTAAVASATIIHSS